MVIMMIFNYVYPLAMINKGVIFCPFTVLVRNAVHLCFPWHSEGNAHIFL